MRHRHFIIPSKIIALITDIVNDYYLNLLSWGSNNAIAVGLQKTVYLWYADDGRTEQLMTLPDSRDIVTSVKWAPRDGKIAIGTNLCDVQVINSMTFMHNIHRLISWYIDMGCGDNDKDQKY